MANPDLVNQLTAGGEYPHEDCGEACVASILYDAGKMDSVRDIERFALAHGDNPSDGTGGDVHVQRLQAAGIGAHVMRGDTRTNILDGIAKGHNRWMVAIWSDHAGDPSPGSGIGHWILIYAYDQSSDTFHAMNPVGGRLVSYSGASIEAAQQKYGVAVEVPIGAATPQPVTNVGMVTAPQTIVGGEENMTRTPVNIRTDANGQGFAQTNIPWNTFVGVTHNGADPRHDGAYWPGEVHASMRDDGNVLVAITRARPNMSEIVFVVSTG